MLPQARRRRLGQRAGLTAQRLARGWGSERGLAEGELEALLNLPVRQPPSRLRRRERPKVG